MSSSPAHPTPSGQLRPRGFLADQSGVAAVEFAFVAGPFLFMLFALIELALVFLLSTSLDSSSDRAARRIRTGQMQADASATRSGATDDAQRAAAEQKIKDDYKASVCNNMTWLASKCAESLFIDVRTFTSYTDVSNSPHNPIKTNPDTGSRTFDEQEIQFAQSIPSETIVVVRSYYKWPLITPFLSQGLSKLDNNVAVVSSTQTFKTEPFQ